MYEHMNGGGGGAGVVKLTTTQKGGSLTPVNFWKIAKDHLLTGLYGRNRSYYFRKILRINIPVFANR